MIKFKRIIAFYIDNIIVSGITVIPNLIVLNFTLGNNFYWNIIIVLVLMSLKDITFKTASIGKKLLGIQIKKDDGTIPNKKILILRNIFFIIWPIDAILVLFMNKKIGDIIFKTKIVDVTQNII